MNNKNKLSERINDFKSNLNKIKTTNNITQNITVVAVSKTQTAETIRQAFNHGLKIFGENYLQEALAKIELLKDLPIEWHFIGHIQTNKARHIANNFSWVQSISRPEVAYMLNKNRSETLPALNCLIQVNIDDEISKSGIAKEDLLTLAKEMTNYPRLTLRGLMAIPEPSKDFEQQKTTFKKIVQLYCWLKEQGIKLDTLSMGMSDDYEAAILEGSNMIRVGTKLFGPRI